MTHQPSNPWKRAAMVSWALLAGVIVSGVAFSSQRDAILSARAERERDAAHRPTTAEIARAVATLKLVTVEIDTSVEVVRGEESWRGDVAARVRAPVRLSYGTDLSQMDVSRVALSDLGAVSNDAPGVCVVRVPAPRRAATEVWGELEETSVETGWARLRSRAGEYYLGLARRDIAEAARGMQLREEDQAKIDDLTRAQVSRLVQAILPAGYRVVVNLDEGVP